MSESKSETASPPPPPINKGKQLAKLNTPLFLWPATVVLAALLFFGLDYLLTVLTHESTDDAFIAAHVVSVAPRVAGQISAVYVLDNQLVHSNDLLVEIDPANFSIVAAQKESSVSAQAANYRAFLASYDLMRDKVATAQATAAQAEADARAAEATEKKAQADFTRAQELRKQNTTSQQEFDAAQAADNQSEADFKSAQENVRVQTSKVDEARSTLAATEAAIGMALAQWEEAKTNAASAQLDLSYTKIFAPCDGRVTRKQVEAGNYVQLGQQLLSLVPTNVWVIANFKESQLKNMKPGQPVMVEIDALGGRKFRAHVDSVQAGSGAAFSLLPPENATGNFVKVVQRVPVKIFFDDPLPADHTLGPGLSVTPSVRVASFALPEFVTAILAIILAGASFLIFQFVAGRNGK
jgi:membrane fusion protein (multidrug efflux system)